MNFGENLLSSFARVESLLDAVQIVAEPFPILDVLLERVWGEGFVGPSLEVSADDLNHVLGGFLCRFRILWHMVEDVVFHEFRHQTVDRTTGGCETVENLGALRIVIQRLEDRLELPDDLFGSIHQVQFFSGSMRHFA